MKRLVTALLLVMATLPAAAQVRVEVQLKRATLIANDHVGHRWSTVVYAGLPRGVLTKLDRYRPTTFETSGELLIRAQAVEGEPYPNYGEAYQTVRVSELEAGVPKTVTLDVVVREDRGRYRGNTARWRFEVKVVMY